MILNVTTKKSNDVYPDTVGAIICFVTVVIRHSGAASVQDKRERGTSLEIETAAKLADYR